MTDVYINPRAHQAFEKYHRFTKRGRAYRMIGLCMESMDGVMRTGGGSLAKKDSLPQELVMEFSPRAAESADGTYLSSDERAYLKRMLPLDVAEAYTSLTVRPWKKDPAMALIISTRYGPEFVDLSDQVACSIGHRLHALVIRDTLVMVMKRFGITERITEVIAGMSVQAMVDVLDWIAIGQKGKSFIPQWRNWVPRGRVRNQAYRFSPMLAVAASPISRKHEKWDDFMEEIVTPFNDLYEEAVREWLGGCQATYAEESERFHRAAHIVFNPNTPDPGEYAKTLNLDDGSRGFTPTEGHQVAALLNEYSGYSLKLKEGDLEGHDFLDADDILNYFPRVAPSGEPVADTIPGFEEIIRVSSAKKVKVEETEEEEEEVSEDHVKL